MGMGRLQRDQKGWGGTGRYSGYSPGPPCSSCWSQPGLLTQRPPIAPAAHLEALCSMEENEDIRHCWTSSMPTTKVSAGLTLQQLPQLLSIGPLLRVLHQGIGYSGQVAHVAFPGPPCRPGQKRRLQLHTGRLISHLTLPRSERPGNTHCTRSFSSQDVRMRSTRRQCCSSCGKHEGHVGTGTRPGYHLFQPGQP